MSKIRKEFIPHPDFRPEVVTNASSAAEGLCKWVRAMDMYDAVAKEVAPKKAKLEIAQREYAATLAVLEEKRAQVRRLEKQLAELRAQFDDANAHKRTLESEFQVIYEAHLLVLFYLICPTFYLIVVEILLPIHTIYKKYDRMK